MLDHGVCTYIHTLCACARCYLGFRQWSLLAFSNITVSIGACGLAAGGTGGTVIGPSICQCAYWHRIGPSTCQCAYWHRIRPACPCALCDRFASNPCGFPGHVIVERFPSTSPLLPHHAAAAPPAACSCSQQQQRRQAWRAA